MFFHKMSSTDDGTVIKVRPNFSYTGVSEKNNETGDTQNSNVDEQKSEETKDFSNSHSHNPNTNPNKKKANPSPNPRKNSAYYQNQCVEETPPPILIDIDGKSKVFKAQDFSNSFVVLILFHHAWDYQGTKEMESFSEHVKKFKDQNCKLLGVSRDGPSVLKDWMDECGWPIPVISDMNLAPKDFGVIQRLGLPLQHGYAVPSAVVIDKKGVIRTIASHSPSDGGCCVGEILRIVTALNQVVVPGDNGKLTPANWDAKQPFIVNTRKGVDDYYYRKYGLREKKYWPSTRSESKGGINNDSKEKGAKSKQEDDEVGGADNNFLTGANDILAVEDGAGQLTASPFSVQFGKKDIWLPRSGHVVSLQVNSRDVPVSMVLDSAGRGYFSTRAREEGSGQYRCSSCNIITPVDHLKL